MHYQAAERSLLLLNSDNILKLVRSNMAKAYPIIVKGLNQSQQTPHWNQTVNTITFSVIRSYMEISKDQFEKLTAAGSQEAKQRKARQAEMKSKWDALHRKFNVKETPSQFPLV